MVGLPDIIADNFSDCKKYHHYECSTVGGDTLVVAAHAIEDAVTTFVKYLRDEADALGGVKKLYITVKSIGGNDAYTKYGQEEFKGVISLKDNNSTVYFLGVPFKITDN